MYGALFMVSVEVPLWEQGAGTVLMSLSVLNLTGTQTFFLISVLVGRVRSIPSRRCSVTFPFPNNHLCLQRLAHTRSKVVPLFSELGNFIEQPQAFCFCLLTGSLPIYSRAKMLDIRRLLPGISRDSFDVRPDVFFLGSVCEVINRDFPTFY